MQWLRPLKAVIFYVLVGIFAFAEAEGTVQGVLQNISRRSMESQSDCVLIMHQGEVLGSYGYATQCEPVDTRAITKSVVSLAIGLLLQEGRICSIDDPVYYFFPEWRQGLKQQITVRHLLMHTSGLNPMPMAQCNQYPDIVRLALAADVSTCPGDYFMFNDKAVNLLVGIIEKASGVGVQQYLKGNLFTPLGISSDSWLCDSAGNNYGTSYLSLNAFDLAKLGVLLANQGCWNGRQLLSREWVWALMMPSQAFNPFCSLLWWVEYDSLSVFWDLSLLELYARSNMPQKYLQALSGLNGFVFTLNGPVSYANFKQQCICLLTPCFDSAQDVETFFYYVEKGGLPLARWCDGAIRSMSAQGLLGQRLIVVPQANLVVVRLSSQGGNGIYQDTFADLDALVSQLIYELELSQCECGTVDSCWTYPACCERGNDQEMSAPICTHPSTPYSHRELYQFRSLFDSQKSGYYRPDLQNVDKIEHLPESNEHTVKSVSGRAAENASTAVPESANKQSSAAKSFDFGSTYEGVKLLEGNASSAKFDTNASTVAPAAAEDNASLMAPIKPESSTPVTPIKVETMPPPSVPDKPVVEPPASSMERSYQKKSAATWRCGGKTAISRSVSCVPIR